MLLCRRLMNILSMIKVITKQTYTTYCLAYVTQLNTMKKWFIRLCFWCICWLIVFCITRNRTQGLRLVETHLLKNSYLFALVRYFWKWFCAKCCLFACLTTMNRKKNCILYIVNMYTPGICTVSGCISYCEREIFVSVEFCSFSHQIPSNSMSLRNIPMQIWQ